MGSEPTSKTVTSKIASKRQEGSFAIYPVGSATGKGSAGAVGAAGVAAMGVAAGRGSGVVRGVGWHSEKLWRETGNCLLVWSEIHRCLHARPPEPLPAWCLEFLAEVSADLVAINPELSANARHGAVLRAVGFGGQGKAGPHTRFAELKDSINGVFHTPEQLMRARNISRERALRMLAGLRRLWHSR
jgi:hypothetical protein